MKRKGLVVVLSLLLISTVFPLVNPESDTIKSWDSFNSSFDETWIESVDSDWSLYNDSGTWKYKWSPTSLSNGLAICQDSETIRSQLTHYVNIQNGEFGDIFGYDSSSFYFAVIANVTSDDITIKKWTGSWSTIKTFTDYFTTWSTIYDWTESNDSIVKMYYNGYSGDIKWKIWNVDWQENNPFVEPDDWTIEHQSNSLKITNKSKLGLYTKSSSSVYFGNFIVNGLYYNTTSEGKPVLYPQNISSSYVDMPETVTEVNFNPPIKYVEEGETFEVNLTLTAFTDIAGYEVDIEFNNTLITVNNVTDGGMFGMFLGANISNTNGTITNICATDLGNVTGYGTLATISITAKTTGGICSLNLTDLIITNHDLWYLYCRASNGEIYVNQTVVERDLTKNKYDVSSFTYDLDSNFADDTIYIESYWVENYDLTRVGHWDGYGLVFQDDFLFINIHVTPDISFSNSSNGDRIIGIFDVDNSEDLTNGDIKLDVWADGYQQSNGVDGTWYIYNNLVWEEQTLKTYHSSAVLYTNNSQIYLEDIIEDTYFVISRQFVDGLEAIDSYNVYSNRPSEQSLYCYRPYEQWTFAISLEKTFSSNDVIGTNFYCPSSFSPNWSWSHWNQTTESWLSGFESDVEDPSTFGKIVLNVIEVEEEEEIDVIDLTKTSRFDEWGVGIVWNTWLTDMPRYKIDLTETGVDKVKLPTSFNYTFLLVFNLEKTFSNVKIFEWDGVVFNQLSISKVGTRTYKFTTDEDIILVVPNPSWTDTEGWYNSWILGKGSKMR